MLWVVHRSVPASRTELYSTLRLPGCACVNSQVPPHRAQGNKLYKKLKSYQFFFEGNVKRLETKTHENRTYVKGSVLPSKKTPYRVVIEFTPQCDIIIISFELIFSLS